MDNSRLDPAMLPASNPGTTSTAAPQPFLDARGMDRLKRQMQKMKSAFPLGTVQANPKTEALGVTYLFESVVELAQTLEKKRLAAIKADRGLALIGARLPEKSLFERLRREKHTENLDECMPVLRSTSANPVVARRS